MPPAVDGPSGASAPIPLPECASPTTAFYRAADTLEQELSLTQGSVDRVLAACADLQNERQAWHLPASVERFRGLARLASRGSGAARQPFVQLLYEVADASDDPWSRLCELLESHDAAIGLATLDRLRRFARDGRLRVDGPLVGAIARIVDTGPGLLREREALETIRDLLRGPLGVTGTDEGLAAMYADPANMQTRRLAARLLDLSSSLPSPGTAARIVGQALSDCCEPYFAYTRATHLDLLDLAAGGSSEAILASLHAAEASCGSALLRDLIGALGWRTINCGLEVTPWVATSASGSFPLLAHPDEAALLDACPGLRRVADHRVIVAHGAAPRAGGAAPATSDAIDRFRRCNLRHADLLVDLLDVAPLAVQKLQRMLRAMDAAVEDFQFLFGDRYADECRAVAARYRAIVGEIDRELASAPTDRPLPATLTRLVQMFEDPASPSEIQTLHGCKRYLHQRGLQLGAGLAETAQATNRTIAIALASGDKVIHVLRAIEYADFEAHEDQPRVPHVVRAAVDAFVRHLIHGERSFPKLRIFCYGNEVHCFAAFRNHPAFIRVDFSPPQRGGMIDLEYCGVSKYDLEWHPNVSLDAIRQILGAEGFDVQVENTRIHARYDKERAADLGDLSDKLTSLFRLAPHLMDVDWVIGDLDLSEESRRDVAAAWAAFFTNWGILPIRHVLTSDRRGILTGVEQTPAGDRELRWQGGVAYRDRFTVDVPGFWSSLRAAVDQAGIGEAIPSAADRPVGQDTLETYFLEPLRRAITRGQIRRRGGRLELSPPHTYTARHEAALLAELLLSDDARLAQSARLARLVGRLASALRFQTTGAVNGYEVQRAMLALPGDTIGFYLLCDGGGIPRLALSSSGDTLYERREPTEDRPRTNWSLDVESLSAELRRANFATGWIEPDPEPVATVARRLRAAVETPSARARLVSAADERCLAGVKASPGRAVGLARPGLSGRHPVDLAGGILIAPALGPRDNPFVFRSAGIVSTGGGVLSHAGLLALQFRKPALVVSGRWERSSSGLESLVYTHVRHREVHSRVGTFDVIELRDAAEHDERIEDGDLLVLDADEGSLRVMGQEHDALALHDTLRQLASASRGLAAATTDPEVLGQRGRMLRARHQLERLLGRIADPALARHAAAELLVGDVGAEPAVDQADKARLLRTVLANTAVGAAAVRTADALGRQLAQRANALMRQAADRIPASDDPLEILTVRLDAIRSRELHNSISDVLQASGVATSDEHPADTGDLDTPARERLCALRETTLASLNAGVATGESGAARRHRLRQLERIDDVLGTDAGDRGALHDIRVRLADADDGVVRSLSGRLILGPMDGGLELWPLTGSKAANLAEAERLGEGALIPRWFVVTDRAFGEALDLTLSEEAAPPHPGGCSVRAFIARTLARRDLSDAQKSLAIAHAWETVRLPDALVTEIVAAYRALAGAAAPRSEAPAAEDPERPFVAVRSSAREEDLDGASRAGEFDTFLFVKGAEGVCESLKRAWSGLWTERAIHNRAILGLPGDVGGGVLIQRMVWARASGVLHTVNLAEGRLGEMVINVGLGLGEGIVSGAVAADQVIVSKQESAGSSQLRFRYITNDKRERVVFDAGFGSGTTRVPTLPHQQLRPALEYVELCEIAGAAARLERAYRQPLDLEFAIEGTALRLLQVRPVPPALAAWRETADRHPLVRRSHDPA